MITSLIVPIAGEFIKSLREKKSYLVVVLLCEAEKMRQQLSR